MNIKKLANYVLAVGFIIMTTHAYAAGYGDDRALIEDLQARYLFAFDFGDAEGYANTFAPDGILDFGQGEIKGRKAIARFIEEGPLSVHPLSCSTVLGIVKVARPP